MPNQRNSHRTAVILFAVAVTIAILAAAVTTFERIETRTASNESPPGTDGSRQATPATGSRSRPAGDRQLTERPHIISRGR